MGMTERLSPAEGVAQLELLATSWKSLRMSEVVTPPETLNSSSNAGPSRKTIKQSRDLLSRSLLTNSTDALTDEDLLELVLFLATQRHDSRTVACRLLSRFGSFANVIAASATEIALTAGLGDIGAAALKVLHAASLCTLRARVIGQPVLLVWDTLMQYLCALLSREQTEHFRILFLDAKGRLITDEAQSRGTVNHTPVYPRKVISRALQYRSSAIILCHNHPSGDPSPSREDITMTRQIVDAARTALVTVQDHIIVGNGVWFSFHREGRLQPPRQ